MIVFVCLSILLCVITFYFFIFFIYISFLLLDLKLNRILYKEEHEGLKLQLFISILLYNYYLLSSTVVSAPFWNKVVLF